MMSAAAPPFRPLCESQQEAAMSFQAYLDTIRTQTGKGPDDFLALARAKGLAGDKAKAGDVLAWLNQDFGLGRGHAMAIYSILKRDGSPRAGADERIDKLFTGARAAWRPAFDDLVGKVRAFGGDVGLGPTDSYVSLLRGQKKFAIIAPSAGRMDVGVKRRGVEPAGRFAAAGAWNAMVTHRVQVADAAELDAELLEWLRAAYSEAG
jgi:hypothetical protein